MNYHFSGTGNLPPGCTQADIDRAFGPTLSDIASEEWDRQSRMQAGIAVLVNLMEQESDTEVMDLGIDYGPLRGALQEAAMSAPALAAKIAEADEERVRDEKIDAAEYRSEMRREYGL